MRTATYTVTAGNTVAEDNLKYDVTNETSLKDVAGNTLSGTIAEADLDDVIIDTTDPTITVSVGGSNAARTVSASDTDDSGTTTWKYKLMDGGDTCNATELATGSVTYTEGASQSVAAQAGNNGKKGCFSSTDAAGNITYAASAALAVSGPEPTRVWSPTNGTTTNASTANITHDFSSAIYSNSTCTTAFTNTTVDNLVKLGTTSGGNDVANDATYNSSTHTITIDPTNTLADDTYYASISNAWRYSDGACTQGTAASMSFTIDTTAPSFTISAVSTDDRINATEDDSAVTISGTSSGLATGATVTVTLDDSDADTTADLTKTDTTDSSGNWSVTLTATEVQTLEEGSVTVKAAGTDTANNTGSITKTISYDTTAPTVGTNTITTSNTNTSYAKQGDTITVSIDFNEES